MMPITNINTTILYTNWVSNIKVLTEIGFNVVATITGGHESNAKFFARLFGINLQPYYVNNPYSSGKKIFLLFDPVHLFKNFYNNFMNYSTFRYPIYDAEYSGDDIPEAKFAHIKELYHIEVGKSIKLAHKLNDKVLNPCVLEKINVKLADSLFHSSTINALIYYSSHGYTEFNYTADFLTIVRNWFNMMNVKTFYHGQQTRDELKT